MLVLIVLSEESFATPVTEVFMVARFPPVSRAKLDPLTSKGVIDAIPCTVSTFALADPAVPMFGILPIIV